MSESREPPVGNEARDILGDVIRAAGKREAPTPQTHAAVLSAVTATWRHTVRQRRRRLVVRWVAVAATTVIAVGIALQRYQQSEHGGAPAVAATYRVMGTVSVAIPGEGDAGRLGQGVDVAAGARLRTASESFVGLRLGDGVSLRLHESTDVTLRSAQMLELHAGRIYIDTGENRPDNTAVQVITERGIIRDIGTQFEVLQEDEQLRLRVREGAVSLESGNLSELGYAGEQLSVDARSAVTRSSIARDDADWRWIENLAVPLRVDNLPITHLLAWVTRETGRDVRFADEQAKAQAARTLLHGSIERLSPIEALDVMLATTDLDYVVLTDGSILIRRQPSATDDR